MSYVMRIKTGTERCTDFFNFLSSEEKRTTREWPQNFGYAEAMQAGIDSDSYNWYIDDLQKAHSIERISRNGREGEFRVTFNDQMLNTTPQVIEAISNVNNSQRHAHIQGAVLSVRMALSSQ